MQDLTPASELEREIRRLVRELRTGLVELVGVGELIAARIIGEVGDVERIPTRRHFASLNGTAPIPTRPIPPENARTDSGSRF